MPSPKAKTALPLLAGKGHFGSIKGITHEACSQEEQDVGRGSKHGEWSTYEPRKRRSTYLELIAFQEAWSREC